MAQRPQHIEPWWPSMCTVGVVLICAILSWFGYIDIATYLFAFFAFIMGTCRLILRNKAPWKVRSVAFDVIISYCLAAGLIITYLSIVML